MSTTYIHTWSSCRKTFATLRLKAVSLSSNEISDALGLPPVFPPEDEVRNWRERVPPSIWEYSTVGMIESRDSRCHVDRLLELFRGRHETFEALAKRGVTSEIVVYWESTSGNGGPTLDASFLQRVSEAKTNLRFDLWFHPDAEDE